MDLLMIKTVKNIESLIRRQFLIIFYRYIRLFIIQEGIDIF